MSNIVFKSNVTLH